MGIKATKILLSIATCLVPLSALAAASGSSGGSSAGVCKLSSEYIINLGGNRGESEKNDKDSSKKGSPKLDLLMSAEQKGWGCFLDSLDKDFYTGDQKTGVKLTQEGKQAVDIFLLTAELKYLIKTSKIDTDSRIEKQISQLLTDAKSNQTLVMTKLQEILTTIQAMSGGNGGGSTGGGDPAVEFSVLSSLFDRLPNLKKLEAGQANAINVSCIGLDANGIDGILSQANTASGSAAALSKSLGEFLAKYPDYSDALILQKSLSTYAKSVDTIAGSLNNLLGFVQGWKDPTSSPIVEQCQKAATILSEQR